MFGCCRGNMGNREGRLSCPAVHTSVVNNAFNNVSTESVKSLSTVSSNSSVIPLPESGRESLGGISTGMSSSVQGNLVRSRMGTFYSPFEASIFSPSTGGDLHTTEPPLHEIFGSMTSIRSDASSVYDDPESNKWLDVILRRIKQRPGPADRHASCSAENSAYVNTEDGRNSLPVGNNGDLNRVVGTDFFGEPVRAGDLLRYLSNTEARQGRDNNSFDTVKFPAGNDGLVELVHGELGNFSVKDMDAGAVDAIDVDGPVEEPLLLKDVLHSIFRTFMPLVGVAKKNGLITTAQYSDITTDENCKFFQGVSGLVVSPTEGTSASFRSKYTINFEGSTPPDISRIRNEIDDLCRSFPAFNRMGYMDGGEFITQLKGKLADIMAILR